MNPPMSWTSRPRRPVHMEATWLPPALASTNGIIDRAPALGVPVEAAM